MCRARMEMMAMEKSAMIPITFQSDLGLVFNMNLVRRPPTESGLSGLGAEGAAVKASLAQLLLKMVVVEMGHQNGSL